MPDYGWAYINLDVLKTIAGPTGSIIIKVDDTTFSGSQYLAFATASNKVGIGLDFPTTMPTHQLHVKAKAGESAAANFTGDILVSGSAFISGTLKVENLEANTVISSSHLIVNDSVIGLGFGDTAGQTGSVGDRGFVFGLAGNLNQAIIWDQTSGSFVMGKVGAQGPEKDNFDITTADLGELRLAQVSASAGISGSVGEFQRISLNGLQLNGVAITAPVNKTGTPADNQIAIFTNSNTVEGDSKLTFDGTTFKVLGPISGSGDLGIVGAAVIEGALSVSGSSILGDAASDVTKIVGQLSSSADAKIAGTTTIAGSLNVSGSITFNEEVSGSKDLIIGGDTKLGNSALFVKSSTKRVGIGTVSPNAILEISGSGVHTDGMPKPMFQILHAGAETGGVSDGKPLLIVTGSTPDGFAGAVGINVSAPSVPLHVAGAGNTSFKATADGKIAVGDDFTPTATLSVRSGESNGNIASFANNRSGESTNYKYNIFFVSGSHTGGGFFGSHHSGSDLQLSGTAHVNSLTASQLALASTLSGTVAGAGSYLGVDSAGRVIVSTLQHAGGGGAVTSYTNSGNNRIVTSVNSSTINSEANLTFDGSELKITGHLSASANASILGTATIEGGLNVSGSSTLGDSAADVTKVVGHLSSSADVKVAGTAIVAGALNVSGSITFGNNLSGSSDLTIGGDTKVGNSTLFVKSSTKRVGIGTVSPNATFEISGSGVHTDGMPKPMFQILHAGAETGGVSDGKPLIIVTGSTPDGFEGRLGINTDDPKASLHVAGAGNTSLLATNEGKVLVGGDYTAASSFTVRSSLSTGQIAEFQNNRLNPDDGKHGPFNIFFVSGSSDGGGYFGSHHSGSNMHLSGTAFTTHISASMDVSASVGNFGTLNINSVAITQGTVDGATIGGTTPAVVNQTGGSVKYRSKNNGDSPYSVVASDYIIGVDTSGGAVQINLQAASSAGTGRMIIIKDIKGTAGTNNITIEPNGSELIDRQANVVIAANSGSVILFCDGSGYFIAGTR